MPAPATFESSAAAFFGGVKSALTSVFFLVLAGTYVGMGALAHDFGFSSWWVSLSTVLVWAAPAQVILISALGAGSALIEAALDLVIWRGHPYAHDAAGTAQGLKAILYAMALIVVYVGLRFDFRFSPGVIIALIHDSIVTLGYFAISGREFNLTSIAVILTVVGYSVNDTVVVFDRIRENQGKLRGRSLSDIVNLSINEVLGRTFLTSFATALSLIGLLIFGVGTIFDFSMAMLFGIISGTYSTWFIAAPMTIWLEERAARKKAKTASAPAATAPARTAK